MDLMGSRNNNEIIYLVIEKGLHRTVVLYHNILCREQLQDMLIALA